MRKNVMDIVYKLRMIFYCLAILAASLKYLSACQFLRANQQDYECFWPPDMIPHPMPPDPDEIDGGKPKDLG